MVTMEINGEKKDGGGDKNWVVGAGGVLLTTMCATGEPLAWRLLLAKQWRDRVASSQLERTNEELLAPVGRSGHLAILT